MLRLEGPSQGIDLDRSTLVSLATGEASRWAGEWGRGFTAVTVGAALQFVGQGDADHVTFHAADGYAASIPLSQAVADGVLLVPPDDGRTGVRLVVNQGGTTCLNVKAVTRIELSRGPGKHTVDPNPHENAFVAGWDPEP